MSAPISALLELEPQCAPWPLFWRSAWKGLEISWSHRSDKNKVVCPFLTIDSTAQKTKPEHFEERGWANQTMCDPCQFSAAITIARGAPNPTLKVRNTKTTSWIGRWTRSRETKQLRSLAFSWPFQETPTPLINGLDNPFGKAQRSNEINRNGRKYNS